LQLRGVWVEWASPGEMGVKARMCIGVVACVATVLAVSLGSAAPTDSTAFWASASAPATLYSPLNDEGSDPWPPTDWCEGKSGPSCAPAAPLPPTQTVSFAPSPVAVLLRLELPLFRGCEVRPTHSRTEDAREGVRMRVERPPRA